jgi:hypothetical protein
MRKTSSKYSALHNDISKQISHDLETAFGIEQGSANFSGYYPKIYLCTTILPPRPESEGKRTGCF